MIIRALRDGQGRAPPVMAISTAPKNGSATTGLCCSSHSFRDAAERFGVTRKKRAIVSCQVVRVATRICKSNATAGADGVRLRFCYEAGPCGYGIQRQLSTAGHECVVVAPSLIPKRAGDRVKTDRRDAASLARLHRAGELTAVWVPDTGHEAMRDLVRAGLDAVHALRRARQQLAGFQLRQRCHYRRPAWTRLHRRWLAGLRFEQAAHHLVLEDYIAAVEAAEARRNRLTAQIAAMLPDWTLAPVVAALQTMRGMARGNAATLIAELGDLSRFANPRQLMAYLGLVPSEHSSGASVRRGGITKAGNGAARRLLIEAAWSYRFPARVSRELLLRQENQPKPIREIAWNGQTRLCAAIAGSPAPASRPMSSPPRSPANCPALSGPLLAT